MGRKVAALLFLAVITLSAGCSTFPALSYAPARSLPIYDAARTAVDSWLAASDFPRRRTPSISL